MKKRVLSTILAIVMILPIISLGSMTASAAVDTTAKSSNVYAGPSSTKYSKIGSVSNEVVTVLWSEGDWAYIKYKINGTSYYKCGYVPLSVVGNKTDQRVSFTKGTKTSTVSQNVYASWEYINSSTSIGSISKNETIYSLAKLKGSNMCFIEYKVSGTSLLKRGWVPLASIKSSKTSANIPNGTYKIEGKSSGKHLDVKDVSKDNGAILQIWESGVGKNQEFKLERLSDDTYKITAVHSEKAIEVRDNRTDNGADVAQWDYDANYACKRWYIIDCGDGWYKFVNKQSDKCLDVTGNKTNNGTQVVQWQDNGGDNQRFKLLCISSTTTVFNENSITEFALLNQQNAVNLLIGVNAGHQAVLLIDSSGRGAYFSFGPGENKGDGKMTRFFLTKQQTTQFKKDGNIDGKSGNLRYTRMLGKATKKGKLMYDKAIKIYNEQPEYSILGKQCDNRANEILTAGSEWYAVFNTPNMSYINLKTSPYGTKNLKETKTK